MVEQAEVETALEAFLADFAATGTTLTTLVGLGTGLYEAMAGAGPLTPAEVASRARVPEPLAREWLKAQAAGGHVAHEQTTDRFALPEGPAAVVTDETMGALLGGLGLMLRAMAADLPAVENGYRDGSGLAWSERSLDQWDGNHAAASATVAPLVASAWIPGLDGVEERLRAGAKVADVGCGYGSPTIAIGAAYPASRVWGFDVHDASVARARKLAAEAGVADRVVFEVASATDFPGSGYDLVTFFDTFHDLGDPVGALRHAREALAPDGTVMLVEFAAGDRLEDNLTSFGRLMYSTSALVCTPNAVSQEGLALGTLAGEPALRRVAAEAGFGRVRPVEAHSPFNLVLELRP